MTVHDPLSTAEASATQQPGQIHWLGWAAYLGASWTWCIGMFLPVLLVRDYGFFGWLVFAVPNVAGAAAMGWVMNSRERSQRVIAAHRVACVAFSLVTIVFHVFFASWFIRGAMGPWAMVALLGVSLVAWFVGRGRQRADVWMGAMALAISVVAFVVLVIASRNMAASQQHMRISLGGDELIWLGAVCCFGFALCPYLDLTFHRARLETSNEEAKSAFQIGFGIFFFAMILFTLWYARFIDHGVIPRFHAPLVGLLLLHMLVQSGYTIALHVREIQRNVTPRVAAIVVVVIALSMVCFTFFQPEQLLWFGGGYREVIYRLFMSFYGLVFPAYAWLCMIPFRRRPLIPPVIMFALATLAAAPFYWIAFIDGRMTSVAYGLGIVAVSRVLLHIPRPGAPRLPT